MIKDGRWPRRSTSADGGTPRRSSRRGSPSETRTRGRSTRASTRSSTSWLSRRSRSSARSPSACRRRNRRRRSAKARRRRAAVHEPEEAQGERRGARVVADDDRAASGRRGRTPLSALRRRDQADRHRRTLRRVRMGAGSPRATRPRRRGRSVPVQDALCARARTARVQEGCTYGPAFLAKLAVDKCADATPIYRVEKAMRRAGIPDLAKHDERPRAPRRRRLRAALARRARRGARRRARASRRDELPNADANGPLLRLDVPVELCTPSTSSALREAATRRRSSSAERAAR